MRKVREKKSKKCHPLCWLLLSTFLCFFVLSSAYAKNSIWWRSEPLKISFAYTPIWKEVAAAESATEVVINWRGKNGNGLVATCYLQTFDSELSKSPVKMLHTKSEEIVESIISNTKKRYDNVNIIENTNTFIDGLPAIYLIREVSGKTLNDLIQLKTWTIITIWQQKEIAFECGSDVPLRFPGETAEIVENQIREVMKTLHFER